MPTASPSTRLAPPPTSMQRQLEMDEGTHQTRWMSAPFQPKQPLVRDTFKNCEGFSRVAFRDGNGVVMLGKIVFCEQKTDAAAGGKKK